jgi:ATP-dependent Clp protease ATP-binding subunit ClpA
VDFEQTMQLAAQESERRDHRYLGTEHALLGLLRVSNAPAASVLRACGLTAEAVEAELARLEEEGVVPRRDGGRQVLRSLGIDIDEVVARLDNSFGRATVDEAACRVTRRPWWRRGRTGSAPLGKPVLVKRAFELAEQHAQAAGREQATIDDVLVGILRDAGDPVGTHLSRRSKRSLLQLDLVPGSPAPVRLIVEARGLTLEQLDRELTAHDHSVNSPNVGPR